MEYRTEFKGKLYYPKRKMYHSQKMKNLKTKTRFKCLTTNFIYLHHLRKKYSCLKIIFIDIKVKYINALISTIFFSGFNQLHPYNHNTFKIQIIYITQKVSLWLNSHT